MQLRVLHAAPCGIEAHVFFGVAGAAMTAPSVGVRWGTAVIGLHDDHRIFQPAPLFDGFHDAANVTVVFRDHVQMLRGPVAMGMALVIHAVKLEIHHGEIVAVHIINGGLNQAIILGVMLINAQAILDDAEIHIVPIAEGG